MKGIIMTKTEEENEYAPLSLPGKGYMTNFNIFVNWNYDVGGDREKNCTVYLGTDRYLPANMLTIAGGETLAPGVGNGILFKPQWVAYTGEDNPSPFDLLPSYGNSKKKIHVADNQQVWLHIEKEDNDDVVKVIIQYDWVPEGLQKFTFRYEGSTDPEDFIPNVAVPMNLTKARAELIVSADMIADSSSKVKLFKIAGSTMIADQGGTFSLIEGSVPSDDQTVSGGDMFIIDDLIGATEAGARSVETYKGDIGRSYKRDRYGIDFDDADMSDVEVILKISGYPTKSEQKADSRYKIDYLTLATELEVM